MQANRRKDTTPELELRRALHRRGHRYRVDHPVLPRRRADIVFTRHQLAVFVDGCWWHGCPTHGTQAKANAEFWATKIETNRRRDLDTDETLKSMGWTVLRLWEHMPVAEAVVLVEQHLAARGRLARGKG